MRTMPKLIFGAPVLASAGISTSRIPFDSAKIICGRLPPARVFVSGLATWSGAVICPALSRGACGRWP
jgi:hypothetical protein